VIQLGFASTARAALGSANHIVVVAPARRWTRTGLPPKLLDRRQTDLLLALARETSPGARGAIASTLVVAARGRPLWLHAAVLPDTLSRYNSPARADSIRHVIDGAKLGKKSKVAIVLLLDDDDHLLAAANAVARALPIYDRRADAPDLKVQIVAFGPKGAAVRPSERVKVTIGCARDSAELVDTPASDLHPTALSERARELLGKGPAIREIVGDELLERGLGGIHAVGRAALHPPRMIVATIGKGAPHVALVGKGVCFDTGGLHIKARGMMETMKADMGGAAAVLGAFRILQAEGVAHRLSLVLCLAENAVDARSYKPDDILRLHSGKTVEINNTDAEGRLLLGDGVSWAARELHADVIVDAATLTGAQLIATGLVHAAVVSNDEALERTAIEAGRASGDLVHPLPFAPELYMQEFKSPIADMRNSVANRNNAQSSCAAQFVYAHLQGGPGPEPRWCHVDLAGPAFPKDRATGYGVALVAELVRRVANGGD